MPPNDKPLAPGPQPVATVGQRVADEAKRYDGDAQGQNGLPDWGGEGWCADFAGFVFGRAGASTTDLSASASSFVTYGRENHTDHNKDNDPNYKPQSGDAVVFTYDPNTGMAERTAIVTAVYDDGTMDIEEGHGPSNTVTKLHMPYKFGTWNGQKAADGKDEVITNFDSPVPALPLAQAPDHGIRVGSDGLLPAVADPGTTHVGGQSVVTGSAYTFVGEQQAPLARHGDRTADGGFIVDQTNEGVYSG